MTCRITWTLQQVETTCRAAKRARASQVQSCSMIASPAVSFAVVWRHHQTAFRLGSWSPLSADGSCVDSVAMPDGTIPDGGGCARISRYQAHVRHDPVAIKVLRVTSHRRRQCTDVPTSTSNPVSPCRRFNAPPDAAITGRSACLDGSRSRSRGIAPGTPSRRLPRDRHLCPRNVTCGPAAHARRQAAGYKLHWQPVSPCDGPVDPLVRYQADRRGTTAAHSAGSWPKRCVCRRVNNVGFATPHALDTIAHRGGVRQNAIGALRRGAVLAAQPREHRLGEAAK